PPRDRTHTAAGATPGHGAAGAPGRPEPGRHPRPGRHRPRGLFRRHRPRPDHPGRTRTALTSLPEAANPTAGRRPAPAKARNAPTPAIREPGTAWVELPRPAAARDQPAGHVRIGYAS